jgi:small subunit ribosomal protein S13
MARIAGVDLPRQKHIHIALTYIYGIGHPRAGKILDAAKVEAMKKVQDLSEEEVNRIRTVIEEQGMVEGDLRKEVSMNIKRLIEIGTRKGPRKGTVAMKKKATAKT